MLINDVFTKRQTIINYPIKVMLQMLTDKELTLKEINKVQVRMIRRYILDNLLTEQIYLPPIVARLKEGSLFTDSKPTQLIVIDGTQRIYALAQLSMYIRKAISSDDEETRGKGLELLYTLDKIEIAVQVFEGFDTNEADQLYIDLNTISKKVALSKRISFDSRNEINQTTNEILHSNSLLKKAGVEQEKRAVMRPKNKNFISLSQLRQLVAYFITGKRISSTLAFTTEMTAHNDENIALINLWFEELFKLHPVKTIGNYEVSKLASFPLLYAVAVYASTGLEEESFEGKKEAIVSRMQQLRKVDWARSSPVWRNFNGSERGREKYYYLANDKKNIDALLSWLQRQGGE